MVEWIMSCPVPAHTSFAQRTRAVGPLSLLGEELPAATARQGYGGRETDRGKAEKSDMAVGHKAGDMYLCLCIWLRPET